MVPASMRAARFHEVNEPLQMEEVSVPEIREDEVLVQVKAAGLCGSDIHIVFEGMTPTELWATSRVVSSRRWEKGSTTGTRATG